MDLSRTGDLGAGEVVLGIAEGPRFNFKQKTGKWEGKGRKEKGKEWGKGYKF